MTVRNGIGLLFSATGAIMVYASGIVVHVWAIIVAFVEGGISSAIPTALLPCISWVYWFAKAINNTGTVMNPYCIITMAMYSLCFSMVFLCVQLVDHNIVENNDWVTGQ